MDTGFEKHAENLMPEAMPSRLKWQADGRPERRNSWLGQQIISPYQLKIMLLGMTKDELDEVRKNLSVRNASSLKKQKLVERLLVAIPLQASEVFACFDEERYQLAQKLVKSGGIIYQPHISPTLANYLRKHGLIFFGNHNGRKAIIMPEEVAVVFRRAAGPELARKVKRNSQWIRLTQGMLFYYGVLDFTQAKDQLEQLTGEGINILEYVNVISGAIRCYDQMEDTLSGVADSRVLNPNAIKRKQQAIAAIDYYPFDKQQLLQASQPDYKEQTPALHDITSFLCRKCNIPPEVVAEITRNSLVIISEDGTMEELLEYLQECLDVNSAKMIKSLNNKLLDLFNHTRRWTLKGHTKDEVFPGEARFPQAEPLASSQPESYVFDFCTRRKMRRNDLSPQQRQNV
ncbi:MAG: hypothetical protein ABFC57_04280 [Veillonellales bacterium]